MKIQFVESSLRENKRYTAEVTRYSLNEEQRIFRLYVRIDKEVAQLEYMKKMELNMSIDSNFAIFCNEMGVFTESGEVELNDLIGKKIIVWLKRGKDDRLYVSKILLDKKFYESQEEEK